MTALQTHRRIKRISCAAVFFCISYFVIHPQVFQIHAKLCGSKGPYIASFGRWRWLLMLMLLLSEDALVEIEMHM